MEAFFAESGLITLGVHIVDAQPTGDDVTMAEWQRLRHAVRRRGQQVRQALKERRGAQSCAEDALSLPDEVKIIAFSAEKGTGRGDLLAE